MTIGEVDASESITIRVLGLNNDFNHYLMKKNARFIILMNSYCEKYGLGMEKVRFRFDGQKIEGADTPASLEMENGDTIEIFEEQIGG